MNRYKAVVPIPLDRLAWKREHSESELQDVKQFLCFQGSLGYPEVLQCHGFLRQATHQT